MSNNQIPDNDPLAQLAGLDTKPDAATKARHIAAAMEAFAASQAANEAEDSPAIEKKPGSHQGILHRLRLTRESNQHGSNSMNTNITSTQRWKNPAWLSSIAASSILVIGALTLTQHLMIDQSQVIQDQLNSTAETTVALPDLRTESESKQTAGALGEQASTHEAELLVVAGVSDGLSAAQDLKREVRGKADAMAAAKTKEVGMANRAAPALAMPMSLAPSPVPDMALSMPESPPEIINKPATEYRDRFNDFEESPVVATSEQPVSTFSIDVDTAAYSFTRRMLNQGQLPAKDAVRVEEMLNYFDYKYPLPVQKTKPFTTNVTITDSPWKAGNKLIHIGIQGYQLPAKEIPQSNLVFLLDVSGSMDEPNKLPLLKSSMELLLNTLKPDDTVAIVVYAGAAGTVLEPTKIKDKAKIIAALNNLQAGGSTAGAEGIALAYQLAEANFNPKGVNRIILGTDGDFNVGQTGDQALQDFVERKREKGIYLSVLGFGQGNYQDALMQTLAQNGNGTAAYIDTLSEAQKILVTEATSSLFPIAKDVKIQMEFNPDTVAEYRLLGYETRALHREDFANDKVDAGEVGSGQRVTAIYEITPVGAKSGLLESSRYQTDKKTHNANENEYGFLRLRYKLPSENKSQLLEEPILVKTTSNKELQQEANFATAVAGFAQLLRASKYAGNFTYDNVIELAQTNKGEDEYGYRTEFIQLVRKAKIAKAL